MDSIDMSQVYNTNALIKRVGRAVAISVDDAALPGAMKNKHVTVLFRRLRWSDNEIEAFAKETDNWIKQFYGDHKAPVLFTIKPWEHKSVYIEGDLLALCNHLRAKFSNLANPADQRPPHITLFRKKEAKCMRKKEKQQRKSVDQKQKMELRLQRMIGKTEKLRARKLQELQSLNETEQMLRELLGKSATTDANTIRAELRKMARNRKHNAKEQYQSRQRNKRMQRERRKQQKQERRAAKLARKQKKEEYKSKLAAARTNEIPMCKSDIGNADTLIMHVDGYNLMGCDSQCRRFMRNRKRKQARDRVAQLLNEFMEKLAAFSVDFSGVNMCLWFDGRGQDSVIGNVRVLFSGHQSVDDRLVQLCNENMSNASNVNVFAVTSDRDLTLRLHELHVKVVPCGMFYKNYLTNEQNNNGNDDIGDEKDEDDDAVMVNVQDTMEKKEETAEEMDATIQRKIAHFLEYEAGEASGTEESDSDEIGVTDDVPDLTTEMNAIFGEQSVEENDE